NLGSSGTLGGAGFAATGKMPQGALPCRPSSIPIAPSAGAVGGTLNYFGWQGYDLPSGTKRWLAAHHAKLKAAYMTNYPDIPPKLHAGGHIDVTNGDVAYN